MAQCRFSFYIILLNNIEEHIVFYIYVCIYQKALERKSIFPPHSTTSAVQSGDLKIQDEEQKGICRTRGTSGHTDGHLKTHTSLE